jgi:hypothetical protein
MGRPAGEPIGGGEDGGTGGHHGANEGAIAAKTRPMAIFADRPDKVDAMSQKNPKVMPT